MASITEFLRPFPDSIEEHNRYEQQMERRQEAIGRYRRQQFELFELDQLFPECPNCGEHGKPIFGVSRDASTGSTQTSRAARNVSAGRRSGAAVEQVEPRQRSVSD
jgi:hypothetical protein